MARVIRIDRLIWGLGALVLVLGGVILWLALSHQLGPREPTPQERARAQIRELVGRRTTITYMEAGRRLSVCGYLKIEGRPVAFVSRPNRLMLETDPLPTEFRQNQQDLCPSFLRPPGQVAP